MGLFKAKDKVDIKPQIEAAIADISNKYLLGYAQGMIEAAFALGAITVNERAAYNTRAIEKEKAEAAKGEPIYKKKGVYEYKDYLIVKLAEGGAGANNWGIQKKQDNKLIKDSLTYKAAIAEVDKLCK